MRLHVVDHPLVSHKLTVLRDENTDSPTFRRLTDELVTLLAYEATREVRVEPVDDRHPGRPDDGRRPRQAHAAGRADPARRPGHARRHDAAAARPPRSASWAWSATRRPCEASTYAERLPDDLSGRQCFVLDPMLATGGTLVAAIEFLVDRGADDVTAICLLAAPEGVGTSRRASRASTSRSPS